MTVTSFGSTVVRASLQLLHPWELLLLVLMLEETAKEVSNGKNKNFLFILFSFSLVFPICYK